MSDRPVCFYHGETGDIHALIGCVIKTLRKAGKEEEIIKYGRIIGREGNMFDRAVKISSEYVEFVEE